MYSFIFMTIGRTVWLVSFILGLLFLGFYQGVKKKKHYFRNGLLLMLCICMMFPVTFGMTRYLPPVWFWGEWSEQKVHSWDAWNSEKYVELGEVLGNAIGRTTEISGKIFGQSPFYIRALAAESNTQKEVLLSTYEEYSDPFLVRKTIYTQYLLKLNLMGHTKSDQGFQLTSDSWVGHAHNIYLQYATDFGSIMIICFMTFCMLSVSHLVRKYQSTKNLKYLELLLMMLIPLLFGVLEYSWGSGSVTIIMLFFCWQTVLSNAA